VAANTTPYGRFGSAGNRLWRAVHADYELGEHECTLLREICRTVDSIAALQKALDKDGVLIVKDFESSRVNPVLAELRFQRLALAKLVAALQLPSGLVDGLAPAADGKPKRTRQRKTKFQIVQDAPGMV
jgi:hypothetical protein